MLNFFQKNQHHFKWLSVLSAIFFIILFVIIGSYFFFEKKYKDKVYPGVYIGEVKLEGLTHEEVTYKINQIVNKINQEGIVFNYLTDQAVLYPLISSVEGDLAYQVIDFNTEKTANKAFNYGRSDNFFNNLIQKIVALSYRFNISMEYTIFDPEIDRFLSDNFSRFETPAENAKLTYEINKYNNLITFDTEDEKYGQIINYQKSLYDLRERLSNLEFKPIELEAEINYPEITKKDVLNIDTKTKNIYYRAPITLKYKFRNWTIYRSTLLNWLEIKKASPKDEDDKKNSEENKNVFVGLNLDMVKKYLEENIAPKINQEAVDSKFEIKDGKVVEFQASSEGIMLDTEATAKKIEYNLSNGGEKELEVITEIKKPLTEDEIENLGIKELLGTGHSNFSGSPKNRIHNIETGAAAVNGTLVKPGEEFSLLATLGEIDKTSGYLPELVIKENKTIPEYGGGLCQIGTTVFRATIESGLPVTLRRNHSYRVSYYEPAGTDATIYDPWPDYRFKNDTNSHILILSRIDGNDLYFDFWGTKDGRIIEKTDPTIYNITKPASTKIIETLDLKPGEKRCTEHAHNGADAYFDYKVTYPAIGTSTEPFIDETRFKSHYVPWREVCLVGVEKLSSDKEKSSSTKEVLKEE